MLRYRTGSASYIEVLDAPWATIVHYDGGGWRESHTVPGDYFYGVWAAATNDVWVVGENWEGNANVLHFDGTSWSRGEPLEFSELGLRDIWGSSGSDLYAVGPRTVLRYDGTGWTKIQIPGGNRVWGTSARDIFILRPNEIAHGTP